MSPWLCRGCISFPLDRFHQLWPFYRGCIVFPVFGFVRFCVGALLRVRPVSSIPRQGIHNLAPGNAGGICGGGFFPRVWGLQ